MKRIDFPIFIGDKHYFTSVLSFLKSIDVLFMPYIFWNLYKSFSEFQESLIEELPSTLLMSITRVGSYEKN